jgi:hypothetical protein
MLNTRLILVEGFPGSGKSTTTVHLGAILKRQGIACRWFLEEEDPHPIACLDFEIKGLTQKMVHLWANFTEQALLEPTVTVIESRLWQNTAMFMLMSECPVEEIFEFNCQVGEVLTGLSPVLIYLDQEDIETALGQLYTSRGEKWVNSELKWITEYPWFQSRGRKDFAAWVEFFKEWQGVVDRLYGDWPFLKIKIQNPHDNWAESYAQLHAFLEIRDIQE